MSIRAVLLGSLTAGAFLPRSAAAHGLGKHADGTLGTMFYYAEIGLILAFALFLAWMLYDRFGKIESTSHGKAWNEQQASDD